MVNMPPYTSELQTQLKQKGFTVYAIRNEDYTFRYYNRKEFYKICINTGTHKIHYADRTYETEGSVLFFGNPYTPYSWEVTSEKFSGYCVLFSEAFLKAGDRSEGLQQSPLFKIGGTPVFYLNNEQTNFISTIFQKMLAESDTEYAFKDEMMRSCIQLIIHEAMKLQPADNAYTHKNAAERITSVFLDLLERQFPIESVNKPLQLKTANDFAKELAVHVNHLNRAVKEITGKPTSTHIAERVTSEAKAMLQHTNWPIAEIGYALGFEYPTHFNNYFKRVTGTNPSSLRLQTV